MEAEPHAPERLLGKLRPSQGDAGPQQAGGWHQLAEQQPPPGPVDTCARGQRLHATLEGTCRETGLPFAGPGALRRPSTLCVGGSQQGGQQTG